MFLLFLASLTIALIAIYIRFNTTEEIVQVGATLVAIVGLLSTIILSPLVIKFLAVVILLLSYPLFSRPLTSDPSLLLKINKKSGSTAHLLFH
ncbi:MAG TPA: hypothetical protein V6C65_34800 [Allocoleopsis sp.]